MNIGTAAYFVPAFLIFIFCRLSELLEGFWGTLTQLWLTVIGWLNRVLNAVCTALSSLPFPLGLIGGAVCYALTELSNALLATAQIPFILIRFLIMMVFWMAAFVAIATAMSVAWSIHWSLTRLGMYLKCMADLKSYCNHYPKSLKIHFVILQGLEITRGITDARLDEFEQRTATLLKQCCMLPVTFTRTRIAAEAQYTNGVTMKWMLYPPAYLWYSCHSHVFEPTVFFIERLGDETLDGLCLPVFTSWVFVEHDVQSLGVATHELGHLCDIWLHGPDPNQVMFHSAPNTADAYFTSHESCLVHTARFGRFGREVVG